MRGTEPDLPPFRVIADALRRTTQHLADEWARPTTVAPAWSVFEWRVALAVAVMQGMTALLASHLRWRGPDLWEGFLAEQREQAVRREQRLREHLDSLDAAAAQAGLKLVGLKGSTLLHLGLYAPGERPMGDIDLLAEPQNLGRAGRMLQDLGYLGDFSNWRHKIFLPPEHAGGVNFGEHADNPIKVELHPRVAERLPVREVDITVGLAAVDAPAGVAGYASHAALMRHLLLHAAGNLTARALRQIQLHDIAVLSTRLGAGDWDELLQFGTGPGGLWWALPPLMLVERLYPGSIPPTVPRQLQRHCPVLLRRVAGRQVLTDVSWSQLRIQAFPGLEWSRTPDEALRFMASRVVPDRGSLVRLKELSVSSPPATGVPWYGLSHASRIVRWLTSRPPRVQTMHSLKLAMAYRPR